ncbi:MAG: hypothetical protein V2I37_14270 [Marinilabiliaceae bacterium]|jgi:hypothetical protein|nr:hypothetical protein [Marinilabiliaceae bacterium]
MKKVFVALVIVVVSGICNMSKAQDFLSADASAFRMQSRFISGIDLYIAPSTTVQNTSLVPTSVNFKAGYKFGTVQALGTLGIQYLNSENFIPLGLELKKYFSTNKWAPFIYGRGGYSIHLKRNINSRYNTADYAQYDPALFAGVGVGYSVVSTLNEFYFSLGYYYHQLEEIIAIKDGETRTDLSMNGVALTVGFTF